MSEILDTSLNALFSNVIREGITNEEVLQEYNKWATTYDSDLQKCNYNAYKTAASKIAELFPVETRGTIKLLDVGAGTGLLGIQLKENGFVHVDGLDPSAKMLEEAKKRGVYENYIVEYLTQEPLNVEKGTYDVVTGSGMFGYSLVPYTAIHEMIRLTKPGGYVVLSTREFVFHYKEYLQMEPLMESLEKEGKWKNICRTIYPNFSENSDGVLHVFQVL